MECLSELRFRTRVRKCCFMVCQVCDCLNYCRASSFILSLISSAIMNSVPSINALWRRLQPVVFANPNHDARGEFAHDPYHQYADDEERPADVETECIPANLLNDTDAWRSQLKENELIAIREYAQNDYERLNKHLRIDSD